MAILNRARRSLRRRMLEVIPHVYQLTIGGSNIIVIAEEELTLVDTGVPGGTAHILNFMRRLGCSPEEISLIILTHNHWDHIGGLAGLRKLTQARVAAHQADIGNVNYHPSYPGLVQKLLRVPPFSLLHPVFSVNPSRIDIPLLGGEVLKPLGGLKVIHTPGHTPGSICLFSPQKRLLIAGDALDKHGRTVLPPHKTVSTDLRQAIDSARQIARLDFDVLCFGHGRPFTKDVRAKMQQLLERIKD